MRIQAITKTAPAMMATGRLFICLIAPSSVLANPQRRPLIADALAGAQYLLPHPTGRSLHDFPQPSLVGRQQQPRQRPLKRAARLDCGQGLDCPHQGATLRYDAVSQSSVSHRRTGASLSEVSA